MRNGYRVIDVDTHVTPSLEVMLRYADGKLLARQDELKPYTRRLTPVPGRGHPATDYEVIRVNPRPYKRVAGMKADAPAASEAGGKGALEGRVENIATGQPRDGIQHDNSAGRLLDMDVEGVDIDVLIPAPWAPGSTALDLDIARGLYDAYHRYQTDYCSADPRRLKGLVLVPGADPDYAVRAIKSLQGEDWVVAAWPLLPENMPVDDPDLDPVWAAMDDADLPILHHSFFYEPPYFPGYRDIWGNSAIARTAAHPWGAQRSLAYVICGGILDRYPNLKVGYAETGHGWLPSWLLRLDSQVHYVKGVVPPLKYLPSDYAKQGRVCVAIEAHEGPHMTKAVMDILGDKCLMYASDFPHPESAWPDSVDNVLKWDNIIAPPQMKKLLAANADAYLRMN